MTLPSYYPLFVPPISVFGNAVSLGSLHVFYVILLCIQQTDESILINGGMNFVPSVGVCVALGSCGPIR